eukprot:3281201-Prymnesium_polylepis.1
MPHQMPRAPRSQLRAWDLEARTLTDRISLPGGAHGARCLQMQPHTLLAGCSNGWVVLCDRRSGRVESRLEHGACVNSIHVHEARRALVCAT